MAGLETELRDATSRYLNALAPDLPPLRWMLDPIVGLAGMVGVEYPDGDEAAAVAQQWAQRCGLTESGDARRGERIWVGKVAESRGSVQPVLVWCIVDKEAWIAGATR